MAEDPATDLAVAGEMVAELEDYIVKDELYRTLTVRLQSGDQRVVMTGGDLLTRLRRLQGERAFLTPEEQQRLDETARQAENIIYSLQSRFHDRLLREMNARLDSLTWFLDDCLEDMRRCRANYPFEMRNRQRIEEILTHVHDSVPKDRMARLQEIDRRIQQIAAPSEFVWDRRLQDIFPRHPYWYLYVRP
jgi:hypothetical protein